MIIVEILKEEECRKRLEDRIVFTESDCNNEILDHVLSYQIEAEKMKIKNVESDLFLISHNGSRFDSYIV